MPTLPQLSELELRDHLEQPHIAKLGTLNPDGTIRITPIWYHARDGEIVLMTAEANPIVENVRRNPQCSILIDSGPFPAKVAHFTGRAEIDPQLATADDRARAWVRYFGGDLDEAKRSAEPLVSYGRRVTIRFHADRIRTVDFTKAS